MSLNFIMKIMFLFQSVGVVSCTHIKDDNHSLSDDDLVVIASDFKKILKNNDIKYNSPDFKEIAYVSPTKTKILKGSNETVSLKKFGFSAVCMIEYYDDDSRDAFIWINKEYRTSPCISRMYIIHELGHCLFQLEHTDDGGLMNEYTIYEDENECNDKIDKDINLFIDQIRKKNY